MTIDTSGLSALLAGLNQQATTAPTVTAPPQMTGNPLQRLAGLFTGSTDLGSYAQKVAAGLSNMGPTGGDPYLAFAQGAGGTGKYETDRQAAAAKAKQDEIDNAIKANTLAMSQNQADARLGQDQSQFTSRLGQDQSQFDARREQDTSQFDKDYALKQAADKRQQMLADQEIKKSAAEIDRLARGNGITVDQQLQIERVAQAAAEGLYGDDRKKAIDVERDRLTKQVQSNPNSLQNGPGITAQDQQPVTATGPDGKKVVLQNGQWVPLQ